MEENAFDIVVVGSGPGGEGAAMQACKLGKSVAIVERDERIGGSCTHRGTIPSKALRQAIFQVTQITQSRYFRDSGAAANYSLPSLIQSAESVIQKQTDMRRSFYDRNSVEVVRGHARFRDPHTIAVEDANGGERLLVADSIILATGARPYRPSDVDFNHPRVFDSDTILQLDRAPRSICIYGAGVIGCEYASMFRNLGVKTNLVNSRERLLEFLDDEISDALSYHLRDGGVVIRHKEEYEDVEYEEDGIVLRLKSGKRIKSEILFWAAGRTGNSDDMGLHEVGIEPNKRGQLDVQQNFRTSLAHVFAVGDLIGPPALASAAYVQGRAAAHIAIEGRCDHALIQEIPTGIYTSPEISSLGPTERALTEAGVPYEVGRSMFKHLARAQILGQTVGMLKILFHRETLEVLGIHCFGANASEIIHIGQAIMSQPGELNSLRYFINTTFNYPTMAEAYRVAALNGFNRLF